MGRAIWTPQYYQKVLALDPIAYWMLDEKSGTVAYDLVSGRVAGAQNGTHSVSALGLPGIGDGRTSAQYDGTNDYTNISSAALIAAFDGGEGSAAIWARVSGAGVWTDGTVRTAVRLQADGNNILSFGRRANNNQLIWEYNAGGTYKSVALAGLSTTDWMFLACTWSASAGVDGEFKAYYAGAQTGATQTALGAWAGNLSATATVIGATTTVPAQPWSGTLGHGAIWDRPLSVAEVASLLAVE